MRFIILLVFMTILLCGCATMDAWTQDNMGTIDQGLAAVQVIGAAAAGPTSGLSALFANLLLIVVPTLIAVNRTIVAHKRKKAISDINANPATPAALDQATTTEAKKAVLGAIE